jgi:hypothetical protein
MSKKLIAACMAIAAFAAFGMASTASAATITHPTGTILATGTKIEATNIGVTKFIAGSVEVECSTATLTGTLTKNTSTAGAFTEGTIETASFTGTAAESKCTSGFLGAVKVTTAVTNGTPYCIKSPTGSDEFQLRGNGCASAARNLTFTLDSAFFGECKYERTTATGPVKGTITTDATGDAQVIVGTGVNSEFKGESTNNFSCPATGSLQMTLTLETDGVASPLYFS